MQTLAEWFNKSLMTGLQRRKRFADLILLSIISAIERWVYKQNAPLPHLCENYPNSMTALAPGRHGRDMILSAYFRLVQAFAHTRILNLRLPGSKPTRPLPHLLEGCPDISGMLRQVALCECEERSKHALVWLAVRTHGCHLCKHPCNLLPGKSPPPACLQECEHDTAVQRHAINACV